MLDQLRSRRAPKKPPTFEEVKARLEAECMIRQIESANQMSNMAQLMFMMNRQPERQMARSDIEEFKDTLMEGLERVRGMANDNKEKPLTVKPLVQESVYPQPSGLDKIFDLADANREIHQRRIELIKEVANIVKENRENRKLRRRLILGPQDHMFAELLKQFH